MKEPQAINISAALARRAGGGSMSLKDFKERLSRYRQIKITVTGRKSGRAISVPVWFVLEEDKLYLLPVQGSETQWYKNILSKPSMRIAARDAEAKVQPTPVTKPGAVSSVIEKFRAKYGAGDVKKYYSKFDVAVVIDLPKKMAH
jgi:deazaflavin-dependent oxidoreductase (nitroreductase family)